MVRGPVKGEATDTDLTGGANARMINKYDYGLLEALKHARRSFVITDPTLPDNPIVFASGARRPFFLSSRPRRVDGVAARPRRWRHCLAEFTIRARGAAASSRRGGTPPTRRRRRGLDPTRRSHTRAPSRWARPGEHPSPSTPTHAVTTKKHRRLPLAHGLQARAGFREKLSIFTGS